MKPFCFPARVYWEDTDGGGVVYYANYLRFLERARTEWLRAAGISQQALAREQGIVFTVTSVEVHYRRPARLDDELLVTCSPQRSGAASVSFAQRILRAAGAAEGLGEPLDGAAGSRAAPVEDGLLAEADVRVVCVDAHTFRPQRLPRFLIDVLHQDVLHQEGGR
ncbi:MAG: tol-pal system-associated acyl-CoA thioesterase [Steroidobacteraceae bacterium]